MDINQRTLADLYIAYRASFQRGLQSREDQTAWSRIATRIPSSTSRNGYPFLGQWPKLREWVGERTIKQLKAHRYEIENKKYESTVEVEREAVEDDEHEVYGPMFEEAGIAAAEWPDDVVFEVLKAGKTGLGFDQVPFFSTSHPHAKDGVVSNYDSGSDPAWYLLDVSRSLKPLIWQPRIQPKLTRRDQDRDEVVFNHDKLQYGIRARGNAGYGFWQMAHRSELELTEANYESARVAMMERTNDEGSSLRIKPMLLVVPPELELAAKKLVAASQNAQGATNVLAGSAEVWVTDLVRE